VLLLDFYCGRWGWGKVFAERGWDVIGFDLVEPPVIPQGCRFEKRDVLRMTVEEVKAYGADFACASSPCEEFSVHGMKHFHPNPKFPDMGLALFCYTRRLLDKSGLPYVMENVRAAQQFVGDANHHCGPFYLWGPGVPAILPQGIIKGMTREAMGFREFKDSPIWNRKHRQIASGSKSKERKEMTALNATIPLELSSAVAEYAERLIEAELEIQGKEQK